MKSSLQLTPERQQREDSMVQEISPPPSSTSSSTCPQQETGNASGLQPVGHAVLLLPYQPEFDKAKASGLAIPDEDFRMSGLMTEMRAVVVDLGPDCWQKDTLPRWLYRLVPGLWRPRALPGDKVMVSKFSGAVVHGPLDGKVYRMVNDQDIFVQIVAEASKPVFPH